jgi:hypothetical protein
LAIWLPFSLSATGKEKGSEKETGSILEKFGRFFSE